MLMGAAMRTAKKLLTKVPIMAEAAPNCGVEGSHVLVVKKLQPKACQAGRLSCNINTNMHSMVRMRMARTRVLADL